MPFVPQKSQEKSPEIVPRIPQNPEAEKNLLGSIFLDPTTLAIISDNILPEDFYSELNRAIYKAMLACDEEHRPIDVATIYSRLLSVKLLEDVGGIAYLIALPQDLPSAVNIRHYAYLIKSAALLRRVIEICDKARLQAQLPMDNVSDFLTRVNQAVFELTLHDTNRAYFSAREVMKSTLEILENLYLNSDRVPGVSTGFLDLDKMTAGFRPGTLNIVAARPAMGKTALGLNFLANAAIDNHTPAAFFSLEMTKEELGSRLLSSRARVQGNNMRTGHFNDGEWDRLLRTTESIMQAPIFVDETPALSITKLSAKARRLRAESNIGIIFIDYLQLMTGSSFNPSREQEISEISRNLKGLAKELNIPIVALAQLNRGVESRPDKRPMLQDLRESGAIEQDADVIAFIYRDDYYNKDSTEKGISEIIIAKQRSGPTGTIKLRWFGEYTLFENFDPDDAF